MGDFYCVDPNVSHVELNSWTFFMVGVKYNVYPCNITPLFTVSVLNMSHDRETGVVFTL